jgi:hypothetical protein
MWRVIIVTLLAVVLFGSWTVLAFIFGAASHERAVKKQGLAGLGGVGLLKEAGDLLDQLLHPNLSYVQTDFLTTETTSKIQTWVDKYNTWRKLK